MKERFGYLLDRFTKKQITDSEIAELKYLLDNDQYEDIIKEDLTSFLTEDFNRASEEMTREIDYDDLYERIRNEIQEAKKPLLTRRNIWFWSRVAAVLAIALGIGSRWIQPLKETEPGIAQHEVEADSVGKTVTFTSKDFIHLPDGSTVLLNENSELSYTEPFGADLREVTLKGEAFFDIKHDPKHAFIVRTGAINTKVLGTAFNVNARKKKVVITVARGLVEVGDKDRTYDQIKPNQRIIVSTSDLAFKKTDLKDLKTIRWKEEGLIFDGITLELATKKLEERFNVKLNIENAAIKDCRISAWFLNGESLTEILDLLCGIRQATYAWENGQWHISGGIDCNAQP